MGLFNIFKKQKSDEEKAQDLKDKNFDILKFDGIRARRMGNRDYAKKCFREALKLQNDFETKTYLAQTLVETADLDEALDLFKQMADEEPTHYPTLNMLSQLQYMLEDYEGLRQSAEKMIALEAENSVGYYQYATALQHTGQPREAIDMLDKAIGLQDEYTEARLKRADILLSEGLAGQALADTDHILAQEPDHEDALLMQGKIKVAQGQKDEAEKLYKHILEQDPFHEQCYLSLGRLYLSQGKASETVALMNDAIDLNASFADAYLLRAEAKQRNNDTEGAQKDEAEGKRLKSEETFTGTVPQEVKVAEKNVLGL